MSISADYKSKFFAFCVLHNITSIEVTFSGSGDSGSFDGVEINGSHTSDLHKLQLD